MLLGESLLKEDDVFYDWISREPIKKKEINKYDLCIFFIHYIKESMPEFIKDLSFRRLLDSLKLTPKHRLVEFGGILLFFSIYICH
jgi:hypothetical protein